MKNGLTVKEIDFLSDSLIAAKDKQGIGQELNGSVMRLGYQIVNREMLIYSTKGVYEICRWSRQSKGKVKNERISLSKT